MDYKSKYAEKKKDPLRPFLPVIGLIIIAIAGAVGYFGAPFALEAVQDFIPLEVTRQLTSQQLEWIMMGIIFLLIVAVFATIFAIFAPKPSKLVKESTLKRERDEKELERRRTKARRRKMKARMKQANKDVSDI